MSEILGFLIAFGLLAAFISVLTSGTLRNIAFGLLIIFAIIVGQERLGAQLSSFNFPFSSASAPATARGPATASYGVGGPTYTTNPNYGGTYPSRTNPAGGYTTSTAARGTEVNRGYYTNDPNYGGSYGGNFGGSGGYYDPYYNDPNYGGSYQGGYDPQNPYPGYGQSTQTGRGVRALW